MGHLSPGPSTLFRCSQHSRVWENGSREGGFLTYSLTKTQQDQELFPIIVAHALCYPCFSGKHLQFLCDNESMVAIIRVDQNFKDFPEPYIEILRPFSSKNLPQTKQNVSTNVLYRLFLQVKQNALFRFLSSFSNHDLYPSFSSHCDMQLNPQNKYRNSRKRELEHMCKPDMRCVLAAQRTCTRVTREHCERNQCFYTICEHFEDVILCLASCKSNPNVHVLGGGNRQSKGLLGRAKYGGD